MACAVSRTESGSAQWPVPGIMRAGSSPAPTSRSSSSTFSSTESELASELVPKTARPTFCPRSQRHWPTKRSGSGERSALNGVTTGESTPAMRWVSFTLSSPCPSGQRDGRHHHARRGGRGDDPHRVDPREREYREAGRGDADQQAVGERAAG